MSVKLIVNIGFDEVCIHYRCKEAVVFFKPFECISERIWQFRDTSLFQFISCQFEKVFVKWSNQLVTAVFDTVDTSHHQYSEGEVWA